MDLNGRLKPASRRRRGGPESSLACTSCELQIGFYSRCATPTAQRENNKRKKKPSQKYTAADLDGRKARRTVCITFYSLTFSNHHITSPHEQSRTTILLRIPDKRRHDVQLFSPRPFAPPPPPSRSPVVSLLALVSHESRRTSPPPPPSAASPVRWK